MGDFFLPFQVKWITSKDRFRLYEKSRRIGITFAEAAWSFRRRLVTKIDHYFVSADLESSKEFIRYIKKFAEAANVAVESSIISERDVTSECVTFPNGARIVAKSSNPTALRGKGGDVTLDEFAFHEKQDELYTAAISLADWNEAHLHIISTHNGASTRFNQLLEQIKAGQKKQFKLYRTTIEDAVGEGYADKVTGEHTKISDPVERGKAYIQMLKDRALSTAMFEQEYMCMVLSASSLVTEDAYRACIIPNFEVPSDTYKIDLLKSGYLSIGVDVARSATGDKTIIWALEEGKDPTQKNPRLNTTYRTVLVKQLRGMPFQAQYEIIAQLINNGKTRKVIIENNGIGAGLAEQLAASFPSKVVSFATTQASKPILCERLSGWISSNRIGMPEDKDIIDEITSVKRLATSKGNCTYTHSDFFMGAALALEAATGNAVNVEFSGLVRNT